MIRKLIATGVATLALTCAGCQSAGDSLPEPPTPSPTTVHAATVGFRCEGAPTQAPGTGDFDVRDASGKWLESCQYAETGGSVQVPEDAYWVCEDAREDFIETDGHAAGVAAYSDCMSALVHPEPGG